MITFAGKNRFYSFFIFFLVQSVQLYTKASGYSTSPSLVMVLIKLRVLLLFFFLVLLFACLAIQDDVIVATKLVTFFKCLRNAY